MQHKRMSTFARANLARDQELKASKKERKLRYESRERDARCKASRLRLSNFRELLGEHIYLAKPASAPISLVRREFVEAHEITQRVPKSTSVPASGDALHQPREKGVHRRRIAALRRPGVGRVHGRLRYERDV